MIIITGFLLFLFIITCILLTVIILLQSSKGEGLASGAFGGGGGGVESFFGGRGAGSFLSKLTTYLAIAFIALALILAKFYGGTSAPELKEPTQEQSVSVTSDEPTEPSTTVSEGDISESGTETGTEGQRSEGVSEPRKKETPTGNTETPNDTKEGG